MQSNRTKVTDAATNYKNARLSNRGFSVSGKELSSVTFSDNLHLSSASVYYLPVLQQIPLRSICHLAGYTFVIRWKGQRDTCFLICGSHGFTRTDLYLTHSGAWWRGGPGPLLQSMPRYPTAGPSQGDQKQADYCQVCTLPTATAN